MSLEHLEQELSESSVEVEKKKPFLKWVLIFFITCFLVIILGGGFLIWTLLFKNSAGVELSLKAEQSITRGIPFELTAVVANERDISISDAKLFLTLPEGVREANTGGSVINEPIGTVQGGTSVKRTFTLISVNEKDNAKEIEGKITYTGENNNKFSPAITTLSVSTTKEPIELAVALPETIVRGAPISFEIQYKNNSDVDIDNVWLVANYPETFHFETASMDPDSRNNKWKIEHFKKGDIQSIEVKGTYEGDDSVPLTIPVAIMITLGDQDYVIASSASSKEAQPSPVILDISVNGNEDYIAKTGDTLTYTVQYENRMGIALKNTVIQLIFSGEMLDTSSMSAEDAVISKKEKVIEWNSAKVPELGLLGAGTKGSFSARVKVKEVFPIKKANDKNYSIKVRAKLDSPSAPENLGTLKTSVSANSETKIGGYIDISSELRYRDPDSGIANSGPFPPKAGKPTEYTIHWALETGATDITNAEVVAELEDGVQFVDTLSTNIETKPEYDLASNSVKWKIPHIPAGRGLISDMLESTFKIRATPRTDQIGRFMPIMKETVVSAVDDFTSISISARDTALSTALPDDPTVGAGGGIVTK